VTRLTLLARSGCHLCDIAREQLDDLAVVAGRSGVTFDLEVLDVDGDSELRAEYGDQVPVVLLDGRLHSYFRVEPDRLLRALQDDASAHRAATGQ